VKNKRYEFLWYISRNRATETETATVVVVAALNNSTEFHSRWDKMAAVCKQAL